MGNYKKFTDENKINELLTGAFSKQFLLRVVKRTEEKDNDFFVKIISLRIQDKKDKFILLEVETIENKDYIRLKSPILCFFVEAGAAYYMRLEWVENESRGVVCKMPNLIYRVQRRRFFRVDVLGKAVKAGFKQPDKEGFIVREVIDIGVGGCALKISEAEAKWMSLGNVLYGFRLKIGPNHYIEPIAAVRFIGTVNLVDGQKHHKCGLEFIKIDNKTEKELSYYVYSLQRTEEFKKRSSNIK